MRFERVQNSLAGRSVGNELAAGQRRAERAALGRMLAFRAEEEGMPAPDIDAAVGAYGLVDLRDLGGRGDRVADDATADMAHDMGHRAVAVDYVGDAGVFHFPRLRFHCAKSVCCPVCRAQSVYRCALSLPGHSLCPFQITTTIPGSHAHVETPNAGPGRKTLELKDVVRSLGGAGGDSHSRGSRRSNPAYGTAWRGAPAK